MKTHDYSNFTSRFFTKRIVLLTAMIFSIVFWMVFISIIILIVE
ncbi:Uncharacterised protein [Serratia proteamaculans]|nr:Uncharacterised protein [Serratia proteamaculans]CAI1210958.1 Uncharacterised protein [Serratia proteamaculans]CAI1613163.1 Uncharacterised protein [Serratia proteamaculans]